MENKDQKIYWHANTSSGGTLSLGVDLEGKFTRNEKGRIIADAIKACYESMEELGYIPFNARVMSSRDIAERFGKSRQYWEKLLNEQKILYKETSAGRVTTDLWVQGYLNSKPEVDKYVKDVRKVLETIKEYGKSWGIVLCPVCEEKQFNFAVNGEVNVNGVCRNPVCRFHIHTTPA
ncbi:MAG: hypothetical protein AAB469_00005 [Patescibacteria group bacterium]